VVHENNEELQDDIRQFLIESNEGLATLDIDIVQLEKAPEDQKLISSVFRSIHTIKGTCGFFGFAKLGAVAHVAENILSQVRAGQRKLTPDIISLVLEAVDKIKTLLLNIETSWNEGDEDCIELIARLEQMHDSVDEPAIKAATVHIPQIGTSVAADLPTHAAEAPLPAVSLPAEVENAIVPSPPATSAADRKPAEVRASDSTIRVDVVLLDKLMNLVGELVLARNQLLQEAGRLNPTLYKTAQRLNLITSELQAGVMKTRMQPVGVVWNKLPRVVRDLAAQCGKQIRIEMVGADTELDKAIIEAIKDPLTHIVRNSCDHGIELPHIRASKHKDTEGLLQLSAYHEGGVVNLEIADDGAGIDPQKMKAKAIERGLITEEQAFLLSDRAARELIFAPGFSTAEQVTSISGRGVGMDVVKTNIEKIGGSVEIAQGDVSGTILRIRIPLTLAIIPGLIVSLERADGAEMAIVHPARERFVVPQANLLELVRLEGSRIEERIKTLNGTPIFQYRGRLLPLVYLRQILGNNSPSMQADEVSVVVLHADGRELGLVVDCIHDTQEIVVKPLARQLKGLTCYSGATIMGDGLPALILDIAGLARLAGIQRPNDRSAREAEAPGPQTMEAPVQMLLLFAAGAWVRIAVPLSLVARLEEVPSHRIERAGGHYVLHYRGDILPLVLLTSVLEPGLIRESFSEMVQVIVFTDGSRRIGIIVDRIVDIVNAAVTARRGNTSPGILGSALIGGKITDLLDLHSVVSSTGEDWLSGVDSVRQSINLLLIDPNRSGREMLSEYLSASNHLVVSTETAEDALLKLKQTHFDVVIEAVTGKGDSGEVLTAIRREKRLEHLKVVGLVDRAEYLQSVIPHSHDYDVRLMRSGRQDLLATVNRLLTDKVRRHQPLLEVA
jgi:two-component system chemotaxis sensor kinase CheA